MPIKTCRRNFLRSAMATGAAAAASPWIWIPRVSHAAVPADPYNHVLIIDLFNGARTVPMFNANVSERFNPFNKHNQAAGNWTVGELFSAAPYAAPSNLLPDGVPSIPEISDEICILGTCDHVPGEASGIGDHATSQKLLTSGYSEGGPGLLSIVHGYHPKYTNWNDEPAFPPAVLGQGLSTQMFGTPEGAAVAPIMVPSFSDFVEQSGDSGGGQAPWARVFEEGIDARAALSRSARSRVAVQRMRDGKAAVQSFRDVFLNPIVDVAGQPQATMHGVNNNQLAEALGADELGFNAALALRFLGFGSAAVVVGTSSWDFHSNEETLLPPMADRLGRLLSGLRTSLRMLQHPMGGSYWDRTLVACVSEMGRDNLLDNGFNSAGGSDHRGDPGSRHQAFPLMGGLLGAHAAGEQIGHTTETLELPVGEQATEISGLLATFLGLLDIDPAPHLGKQPLDFLF